MRFSNEDEWNEWVAANADPYGKAIMDYARKWAELMEAKIEVGIAVQDCAEQTSHEADEEDITGFMYGAAVNTLARCWYYGEELRLWHNSRIQIGNEGEKANEEGTVLNPAVLSIRTD